VQLERLERLVIPAVQDRLGIEVTQEQREQTVQTPTADNLVQRVRIIALLTE